jgi:hypothetical protein
MLALDGRRRPTKSMPRRTAFERGARELLFMGESIGFAIMVRITRLCGRSFLFGMNPSFRGTNSSIPGKNGFVRQLVVAKTVSSSPGKTGAQGLP